MPTGCAGSRSVGAWDAPVPINRAKLGRMRRALRCQRRGWGRQWAAAFAVPSELSQKYLGRGNGTRFEGSAAAEGSDDPGGETARC